MHYFVSAGEPSGDLHAANLIRSLRAIDPQARFTGFGGERMAGAGATLIYPLVNLAVMWFLSVFANLVTFFRLILMADRHFRDERPDAVILIDYPGLHWWIAKRAKARGVPVFYFVPPQIWAWGGWRVRKVREFFDLVLCSLPFEPAWYHARGVSQAVYIGHPYFDELADRPLDPEFLAQEENKPGPMVAMLPGSRTQELVRNFPVMLRAATALHERMGDVRFAVACLHERHQRLAQEILEHARARGEISASLRVDLHAARTPELIRLAKVAWAVSGSVGLELMVETLPSVVLYKVKRFDLWVARHFIKSKYISLVNLLADAEVFPEYLTWQDASGDLARWAETWLSDPAARERTTTALREVKRQVAAPGASDRAARHIRSWLEGRGAAGSVLKGPKARDRAAVVQGSPGSGGG